MKKFFRSTISMVAVALMAVGALGSCAEKNPVLTIEGGQVQGVVGENPDVYVYKGIPYAAAPVGDLRWQAPQPVTPWEGVKVADKWGNAAYQAAHREGDFYQKEFFWEGDAPYSEDCLYLNVWTPKPGKSNAKLPVTLWIHGGGYTAGWGFEPEMDGEEWAKHGVVLVTFNYRLGVFGFFTHPLLSEESPNGVSGNYGMLDQIAALKWVKENIAQFGGDPDNITIMGQSAGAMSVQTLLASDLSKNLISKAIIQSGGGVSDRAVLGGSALADGEAAGKKLMDWAGYDTLEKMRAASTEEIYNLSSRYMAETREWLRVPSSPVVDGYAMKENFSQAVLGNRVPNIPYMIGGTLDDMGGLGAGPSVARFCTEREKVGGTAYAYQFARKLPGDDAGAFHSSELWYMFKSLRLSWRPFTEGDYELAERMITAWTNFAKTGNPNGKGEEVWTPFTEANPKYMVFRLDENDNDASSMEAL